MSAVLERATLGNLLTELTELPDEISLHVKEELTVLLPSRAGAGYVWEAGADDEAVVEASTKFETADAASVGNKTFSQNELLTLRALSEGTTRVHLVQRRAWEKGVEPIAARTLEVNVAAPAEATKQGGT
ncbi:MAG: protease inhibitor I42 family protein [Actinomycetota bacterium]